MTMPEPIVSILIPVYNREDLIVPCIQSALDQTMRDIEIIVVDNCSTDRTFEICQELARTDPRLRVFRNDTNIGPVRNWMKCAGYARGRFGRILFSDDLMMPAALEKSVPYLEDPEVGLVVTAATVGREPNGARVWYTWGNRNGKVPSSIYIRTLMADTDDLPVSPCSSVFRLADIRRHLMPEFASPTPHDFAGHGAGPDLLLSLLTAAAYPAIVHLADPLAFFRTHAGSITAEKTEIVMSAYSHARIWFARQQPTSGWLDYAFGVAWIQTMRRRGGWVWPTDLRTQLLFPSEPQPRLLRSLSGAVTGWALPRLGRVLRPGDGRRAPD